jgi:hypothetical protein
VRQIRVVRIRLRPVDRLAEVVARVDADELAGLDEQMAAAFMPRSDFEP